MSNLKALRSMMNQYLSETEIRGFCLDSNIEFEDLEGEGKRARIISLLNKLKREDKLLSLISWLQDKRPDKKWILYIDNLSNPNPDNIGPKNQNLPKFRGNEQVNLAETQSSQINQVTGDNAQVHIVTNVTHNHRPEGEKKSRAPISTNPSNDLIEQKTETINIYFNVITLATGAALVITIYLAVMPFFPPRVFLILSQQPIRSQVAWSIGLVLIWLIVYFLSLLKVSYFVLDSLIDFWGVVRPINKRRKLKEMLMGKESSRLKKFLINWILQTRQNDAKKRLRDLYDLFAK